MKKRFYSCLLILGLAGSFSQPVLAQWSSSTPIQARDAMAATSVGGKVLFAGGDVRNYGGNSYPTKQVNIYTPITGQWTSAQLSKERSYMAATSTDNLAFFAGGSISTLSYFTRIDIYNATTEQWTTAELSKGRFRIGAASAGGKVLFAGGTTYNYICNCYTNYNTVDVYDIATNQWSVTQLPTLQGSMLATSVGNKILFTKSEEGSGLIDIYDVTTGQWTTANTPQSLPAMAASSAGNKALFAVGTPLITSQICILDVMTGQWTTATLPQARRFSSTTSLGNKVFFAGGWLPVSPYTSFNVVDIYDVATNQWSATQLPQASGDVAAASAGNQVLFAENRTYPFDPGHVGKVDIYTINASLPVNLISFSGVWAENQGAQLSWQTSLETNNDHFEIQRSSDATSFETIGRIKGKGTIEARTEYSITDADMPGQIGYYRLKQVDFDGSAYLSNIISVNRRDTQQPGSITLGPVPTSGTLAIQISAGKTIREIGVYDLHGRQLSSQVGPQTTIDVSDLPAGIYLLDVLTTDGQRLHTRLVKQ